MNVKAIYSKPHGLEINAMLWFVVHSIPLNL